ncbi:unnamed protein product [Orchesella dallaii]|uniref:Uncharacterized protein n=1 Tax=Orchesella dallaii TaxID=48710 RepID=A0ABP1QQ34_9HEXA
MPSMNVQMGKSGLYFPPNFVPCSFAAFGDRMNFKQRVLNFIAECFMLTITRVQWVPYLSRDHLGSDVPDVDEIDKNVTLLLMNTHFSLTYPRPLLPDVVEVGGHLVGREKWVHSVQSRLNCTTKRFADCDEQNVFSKLKQKVIWKWDGDLPGEIPANVKVAKWLPQQDISLFQEAYLLGNNNNSIFQKYVTGHPNIKILITHGGLFSTQEAVFHGLPLIGFPFFADQDLNIIQAEKAGFALSLEINDFTEEMLENAINKILTDDRQVCLNASLLYGL